MKTHLFQPGSRKSMCGKYLWDFSTTNPDEVDCKTCIGYYIGNQRWYQQRLAIAPYPGPSDHWDDEDQQLPGLFNWMFVRPRPNSYI